MKTIETPIVINAAPWEVWSVLTKSHEYDNWNPIYQYISGTLKQDSYVHLETSVKMNELVEYMDGETANMFRSASEPKKQKHKFYIKELTENRYLNWESKILWGFLTHIDQFFSLTPIENERTLFVNSQSLGGFLVKVMPAKIFQEYFTAVNICFNERLKEYVEHKNI